MQHECKITVLETKVFPDLQEKYLAAPKSGPCPFFHKFSAWILVTSVMRGNALLPPFKPKHMFTTERMCAILLLEK